MMIPDIKIDTNLKSGADSNKTNFLEYSFKKNINVIPKENYEDLVHDVFNTVAEILSKSYGPLGSHTTISEGMWNSATKDGYTIFKNLIFRNRYKAMIYDLMRSTCTKLNNTVGDGTTTAILLADKLYDSYKNFKSDLDDMHLIPREFNQSWDKVINNIIESIKTKSRHVNDGNSEFENIYDMIYNVAYIASNGNEEISRDVAKVYMDTPSPMIKLKNSPTNKCYMNSINGFEFPANLIDEAYCKNEDMSVEENNVKVLIFSFKVDSEVFEKVIKEVNEIYRANNTKILVLAPSYDELLMKTELKSYINNEFRVHRKLNLIFTQYLFNKLNPNQLEDLASVLDCEIINLNMMSVIREQTGTEDDYTFWKSDKLNVLGDAKKVSLSIVNGTIFRDLDIDNDKYKSALNNAYKHLDSILDKTDNDKKNYSLEISQARARISQLQMKNYVYYVGSDSQLTSSIVYDMADDVVKACSSAYKYGIVPGCQLSIIKACEDMLECKEDRNETNLERKILVMVYYAVIELYRTLLEGPELNGFERIHIRESNSSNSIIYNEYDIQDEDDLFDAILKESINNNGIYDLVECRINKNIITSLETDINVLLSASELVKLLVSGNQFIFRDAVLDSQDEVQITP